MVAVALGLALLGNIGWFYLRNHVVGGYLLHQERSAIASASATATADAATGSVASCPPLSDTASGPQGLLEAGAIGLEAPVLGGDADAQLNVAVGHVPGSAWPGQPGTAVLAAHDVTYFSGLGGLAPGDRVQFVTPCATDTYQVTGHQIVTAGTPIESNPAQSVLVLETCYPTDALYFTNQRYLLTATLVASSKKGGAVPPLATPSAPTVPVPSQLAAQGLTLGSNEVPMGTEHFDGSPSSAWRQSAGPFVDEAAALTAYFGAVHAAEQDQGAWWAALAPSVPASAAAPLVGGSLGGYDQSLDVTLDATGSTFVSATLTTALTVDGGAEPGTYRLTVVETNEAGVLRITAWEMTG